MTHTEKRAREERRREVKRQTRRETLIGCIGLIVFLLLVGRVGYWETHYNRDGVVTSVSGQLVEVEDKTGLTWEFYGDGFRTGDNVRMVMFNGGTDGTVYDDEIIDVKLR